ncbi:MAG: molybdopterin-dependent oxidoreductase [Pseudomonadota bacterium]
MSKLEDLPLTSTHWGVYRTEVTDQRVSALHPFEADQDPSPIGPGIVDVMDGPSRITAPMVRQSWLENGPGANPANRGREPFVEVTWAQASALVAREIERIRSEHGNEAIFGGSYGWASAGRFHHAQSQLKRFLNCIGGYTNAVNTYSYAAAEVAIPHVIGSFRGYLTRATSWPSIIKNTELFVAFGGVPLKNGQINAGGVGEHTQKGHLDQAIDAGIEFVTVSPLRSDMPDNARSEWLALRPSTDTALLLGLAHTLLVESLVDRSFIERCTVGFDVFAAYLLGEKDGVVKSAEWAAQVSEIDAETIRELARRMATKRTMISVSWSLTRQDHGEQPFWAALSLASMLGQIGLPGGGIGFGYSAINAIGDHYASISGASLPQGKNAIESFIPVARISDMLLNPGASFTYNGQTLKYPDVRMIYWAGGNPFHHHQDLNRMLKAWQKPDTIVVHEWCWNAHAKHADIVLPCTTPLERNDIGMSPRDPYLIYMSKAVEPIGESRNDYDAFAAVAEHLNVNEDFTEGRDETAWLNWIYEQTVEGARQHELPAFDSFAKDGWIKLEGAGTPKVMMDTFRENPEKYPLRTPSGKIEIFSETVASFGYVDCPGHASWFEPAEWLGNASNAFPLHLISNQPYTKLHSQLDHGSYSRASKIHGREPIRLHPQDAAARNLKDGDIVRVTSQRGACLAGVIVDDAVRESVVQLSTGAWFDPADEIGSDCKHGNPNVLTIDKGTSSLAQGPIAHSCLVQVTRFEGTPPAVTAFEPPEIIARED